MKRSLTDITKDMMAKIIDCVELQYPIYPHIIEPLKKELELALGDSDVYYVKVELIEKELGK
jgi:hypothetical protein